MLEEDGYLNKKDSAYKTVILLCHCIVFFISNKSAIILLLKTVDSLGIFELLFLSILYIDTGYEEEEY
jgi:hypothetical protein